MTSKTIEGWAWYTHISYFDNNNAVGTDMTDYINVDYKTKNKIEIDSAHYDGRGKAPNIGNWMVDYIDTFTLVNQGNKERKFTYSLKHTGVILAFVRDENGFVDKDVKPRYYTKVAASSYGDAIEEYFEYDEQGRIVQKSMDKDSDGKIDSVAYYKYDDAGNVSVHYDDNADGKVDYIETTDENGETYIKDVRDRKQKIMETIKDVFFSK